MSVELDGTIVNLLPPYQNLRTAKGRPIVTLKLKEWRAIP